MRSSLCGGKNPRSPVLASLMLWLIAGLANNVDKALLLAHTAQEESEKCHNRDGTENDLNRQKIHATAPFLWAVLTTCR
jgi:hypothetical protein